MAVGNSREHLKGSVKEAADIVQIIGECVELKKAGSRFTGLCPFHAEKTPSFSVNPQGQFFHCFGCGESGDVFSFVMKYHHMGFPEALKTLARRYNIDLPEKQMSDADRLRLQQREQLYAVNEAAADIYLHYLLERGEAEPARTYLKKRGVPEEVIEKYRLGYAPDPAQAGWNFIIQQVGAQQGGVAGLEKAGLAVKKDRGGHYDRFRSRIMFPIQDMTGRVVAFGGRVLGDEKPKYLNSPESLVFDKSRLLFGLFQHKEAIRKQRRAIVVEGNFDLLLLAVHGIDNVVAPLGTALTRKHVSALRGYCDEVVLLFDADTAGLKAALRSVPFFLTEQVEGRVALLPEGHDPDSFVRQEGPEGITRLVDKARPLPEFVFESLVAEYGLTLSGKNRIVSELKVLVKEAVDPVQRSLMKAHFGEKLGVASDLFDSALSFPPEPPRPVSAVEDTAGGRFFFFAKLSRRERQLVDFLILNPEYLGELEVAALELFSADTAVNRFVALMKQLADKEKTGPEYLLASLADKKERDYIVDLLIRKSGEEGGAGEKDARLMCDELQAWLQGAQASSSGAELLQQIAQAERDGDQVLLMELIRQKQEFEKKRTGL